MVIRITVLLFIFPAALFAESYGTQAGCAYAAGQGQQTADTVLWDRTAGTIKHGEMICQIEDVMQVGSGAVNVGGPCAHAGKTLDAWFLISSLSDETHYIISPETDDGMTYDVFLCE